MARPTKHQQRYRDSGRPTVMTIEVLQKLEDAFANAFTDEMACLYAGIGVATLYDYCRDNPKFSDRKEQLKHTPSLKAQQTLIKDLDTTSGARWWAEHTMPHLAPKSKVEINAKVETTDASTTAAVKEVVDRFEAELREKFATGQ